MKERNQRVGSARHLNLNLLIVSVLGYSLLERTSDQSHFTTITTISKPVFVHIPKTGGSSIENSLRAHGIDVGAYAFLNSSERRYPIKANVNCPPWHVEPEYFVANSVAIVRDPWDRLLNEFCFTHEILHSSDFICTGLSAWIISSLARYINGDRSYYNFHFVPQWEYAQKVERILSFSSLKTGKGVEVLGDFFHVKNSTLTWENNGEITKPVCKTFTKT